MSSDPSFDEQLKNAFDGFEPNVHANWEAFEQSLNGQAVGATGLKLWVGWSMVASVILGGAIVWFGLPEFLGPMPGGKEIENPDEIQRADPTSAQPPENMSRMDEGWSAVVLEDEAKRERVNDVPERDLIDVDDLSFSGTDLDDESDGTPRLKNSTDLEIASLNTANAPLSALNEEPTEDALPFAASVRETCQGNAITFEAFASKEDVSYLWNFGDGSFSVEPTPKHVFLNPGTYDITLSVRSKKGGMVSTKTVKEMVKVFPEPQVKFTWSFPSAALGPAVEVQLIDETRDATSTKWVVQGESNSTGTVTLPVPGIYPVNLVASNEHGCLDNAHHNIHLGDRLNLQANSSFSPNGDGFFDTFMPTVLTETNLPWEMVIATSGGEEIFRTSDASQSWDGKLPNGTLAPGRTPFWWSVRMTSVDGEHWFFTDKVFVEL